MERNFKLLKTALDPYFQSDLFKRHTGKIMVTLDMNQGGIGNIEVVTKKSHPNKKN